MNLLSDYGILAKGGEGKRDEAGKCSCRPFAAGERQAL